MAERVRPTDDETEDRLARARSWQAWIRQARWPMGALFVASFAETIIVPVPIELVLVPLMLALRDRIWWIATITTLGCLAGAVVGYGVGYFLFEEIGRWLIGWMGWDAQFAHFQQLFDAYGFLAILAIGVIPIPFQIAMLAAGIAGYPFLLFMLAAVIARGIRYYGLAALVLAFGSRAGRLWQQQSRGLAIGVLALLALLVLGIQFAPQLLS
jgi:membrane protein YqaA with SNARE-associated domain